MIRLSSFLTRTVAGVALAAVTAAWPFEFSDSHFHLTNYIQEGLTLPDYIATMGDRVKRAAVFGIPLQQKWDWSESGERAPDYYLLSDAELYYYSFVDAMIADQVQRLSADDRARIDPMITGFNPTDMYAVDHIRRVLRMYPGVFTGIGEFTVHKEFVSAKVAGHTATLRNPALERILDLAGETGLIVLMHNDINTIRPAAGRPAHFDDMRTLLRAHPSASVIWAHTGLGRVVKPTPDHVALLREFLSDETLGHVNFDISWDEVAKWIVADEETLAAWTALLQDFPDRFLFGTDAVAPKSAAEYGRAFEVYAPLWQRLDAATSVKVRMGNYERLFDAARAKVRMWEAAHAGR